MNRLEMAQQIVDWEARRDAEGRLRAYRLPANDGGGSYEVAGINERYHPHTAAALKRLLDLGKHKEAETRAVEHIASYTDAVKDWVNDAAVELFLRDCCFNRGPGGAAKILQLAVGAKLDGHVGDKTKLAAKKWANRPILLLARLRMARERYEDLVAPGRLNLRAGLENRWDKAFDAALMVELGETKAMAA